MTGVGVFFVLVVGAVNVTPFTLAHSQCRATAKFQVLLYLAIGYDLVVVSVRVGLQYALEVRRVRLRVDASRFGVYANHTAGAAVDPERQLSRAYTHIRTVLVWPLPGASAGMVVSSVCISPVLAHSVAAQRPAGAPVRRRHRPSAPSSSGPGRFPGVRKSLLGGTAAGGQRTWPR